MMQANVDDGGITLPELPTEPVFSADQAAVIFVLGAPGTGKGTQCERLAREVSAHRVVHLSAGDLLREERQHPDSPYGSIIQYCIDQGQITPQEITISLLLREMRQAVDLSLKTEASGSGDGSTQQPVLFLIDGFPRDVSQGERFEQCVIPCRAMIFFECNQERLVDRLVQRGQTSGRSDDNLATIAKRFDTYVKSTVPVRHHYEAQGKLFVVDTSSDKQSVFVQVCQTIALLGWRLSN